MPELNSQNRPILIPDDARVAAPVDIVQPGTRESLLAACELALLREDARRSVELTRAWAATFPPGAGVYAVYEHGELAYVGETGSLAKRMRDLCDSRNHTLRRSLGAERFASSNGGDKATASRKFSPQVEERLNEYMRRALRIVALPLPLGRKEVEEHMVKKYKPPFNQKGQRC